MPLVGNGLFGLWALRRDARMQERRQVATQRQPDLTPPFARVYQDRFDQCPQRVGCGQRRHLVLERVFQRLYTAPVEFRQVRVQHRHRLGLAGAGDLGLKSIQPTLELAQLDPAPWGALGLK